MIEDVISLAAQNYSTVTKSQWCFRKNIHITEEFVLSLSVKSIQYFDIIVSSEISLEMEALNEGKDPLISTEIEKFDRLRPGLNSFHVELFLI